MIGNYVYLAPEGKSLCLFRRERSWLPAGIIRDTNKGIATIKLFPIGEERLGRESITAKLRLLAGIKRG